MSECGDAGADWYPQRSICYPTMQREAVMAMYHEMHKTRPWHDGMFRVWMPEQSALTPFHYTHGVSIWMASDDLTPDDDWLGQSPGSLPSGTSGAQ